MFKAIESITSKIAVIFYQSGRSKIGDFFSRISWRAYDHCPKGYKGR